jgi:four helix bundle protein
MIDLAGRIIRTAESLPENGVGRDVAGQLDRSDTSPAANYPEAQGAESRADFIHEMKTGREKLPRNKCGATDNPQSRIDISSYSYGS